MSARKPPTIVDLEWQEGLRFAAHAAGFDFILDGDNRAAPSPVQNLAASLAGCMAIDVVDILTKGRHLLRSVRAHLEGERAAEPPRRFVRVSLSFALDTDAPDAAIERAIALSREKYCSVWHSMRRDIALDVTYSRKS